MIIISCETARVLFVSDTITQVLNESVVSRNVVIYCSCKCIDYAEIHLLHYYTVYTTFVMHELCVLSCFET